MELASTAYTYNNTQTHILYTLCLHFICPSDENTLMLHTVNNKYKNKLKPRGECMQPDLERQIMSNKRKLNQRKMHIYTICLGSQAGSPATCSTMFKSPNNGLLTLPLKVGPAEHRKDWWYQSHIQGPSPLYSSGKHCCWEQHVCKSPCDSYLTAFPSEVSMIRKKSITSALHVL